MTRADSFRSWTDDLDPAEQALLLAAMPLAEARAADGDWPGWAHRGQHPPPACSDWSTWVLMAGRGFGKTLAGAQWIASLVATGERLSIALVGATLDDARRVMVEGRSGLIAVADAWVSEWHPNLRRLRFRTGAEATIFSGASPDSLRGPEHHFAWCDELAKWEKPQATWDMLQLGLRLGPNPRALVTTTPRPGPVLNAIMADPATVTTGGSTLANPHTPRAYKNRVRALYEGTRLGRQELDGELLTDAPGALWTVGLIEKCRSFETRLRDAGCAGSSAAPQDERNNEKPAHPEEPVSPSNRRLEGPPSPAEKNSFTRIVIAVDPPVADGTCGIVACARDDAGMAHVLADHSVAGRSPEGWTRAVADAATMWRALVPNVSRGVGVVAESNQGGKMVEAVLRTADPGLRVRLVTATVGKAERAAPVAMLFEAGKVVLHGRFPELEAQLLGMIAGGDYEGPGTSPDRADAMVWGLTELMLRKEAAEPRIMRF